jgi:hypothetical protein
MNIEVIGRNCLVSELAHVNVDVALPVRADLKVDLIAFVDGPTFIARPIQLKAWSARGFSIEAKYANYPGLLLAHLWHLADKPANPVCYCLTYAEALALADQFGWTKTDAWLKGGKYVTTNPSKALTAALDEQFRMTPEKWVSKIAG